MKTIIFTQRVDVVASYNERRDCADQRIAAFLFQCGFLPIPIPNDIPVDYVIDRIRPDGIVLTGGNSLVSQGGNAPERDATDKRLIDKAVALGLPLYGFCRGMQSILDYFGEELVAVKGHVAVRTMLSGVDDAVFGNFNREVNSYHNQGCVRINSDELEILAKSQDGVIKAIRHNTLPILGTMWHPERETPFAEADKLMVKHLFN